MIKTIMKKRAVSIGEDKTLRDAISLMDKYDYKELPVVDANKRVVGILSYHDILSVIKFKNDTKVYRFMKSCSKVKEDEDEKKVLDIMVSSGITGLPVVDENNKLVGFVSDYDILKFYSSKGILSGISISEMDIKKVEAVKENAKIGVVRNLMNFNKVDRLPVVDKDGKFVGAILLIDILRTIYKEPEKSRKGMFVKGDLSKIMDIEIRGLIRKRTGININSQVKKAIELMLKENIKGVIVLNSEKEPIGVLDRYTILKRIDSILNENEIEVEIVGVPKELSERLRYIITHQIKAIPKRLKGVRVFVKRIHDTKIEKKVEIKVKAYLNKETINIKRYGEDVLFTLSECIDVINELIKKKKR